MHQLWMKCSWYTWLQLGKMLLQEGLDALLPSSPSYAAYFIGKMQKRLVEEQKGKDISFAKRKDSETF